MMTGNKLGNKSYLSSPAARAMMRNLSVNVRALRQQNGWTLKKLGEVSGVPWRALENLEAEVNIPSFVTVCWLAEAFDITVNRLIYYPREALDGPARDKDNGRFAVQHPPMCECADCWQAMEAGGL